MYVETDGLVIRQVKTGDGRRMLLLFTRNYGKISAGTSITERGKNKSALAIRPFTYGHYDLYKTRDNYNLSSAEVKSSFYAIGEDVEKFLLASQMLEFTDKLLPEDEPNEKIFDILVEFLTELTKRKSKLETLSSAYQLKALSYSGLMPQLNVCVDCGKRIKADDDTKFVHFSVPDGGFICNDCVLSKKDENLAKSLIFKVNFDIVDILKYFVNNQLSKLQNVALKDSSQRVVTDILESFAAYHLGLESLKSKSLF